MKPKAKWNFMIYMAGDNNLSAAGDQDLVEMRKIGSSEDVNILVQFDNAGNRGTNRYLIQHSTIEQNMDHLDETDCGDPKVLLDFVQWGATIYPAERYALILWNHGGGWEPSEIDKIAKAVGTTDYNPREASERSSSPLGRAFFRTTVERIYSELKAHERAICCDDGSGHSLDTVELGNVLAKIVEILGQPLDLLGMDACLMSNFEVAYQIRPYVHYVVASEESEPIEGWPYDAVLRKLIDDPMLNPGDLAIHIVGAYILSYLDKGYKGPITQSAIDVSRVADLANALDVLAEILGVRFPNVGMAIWTAQRNSAHFWHNTLWDIADFCNELMKVTDSDTVRNAAEAVLAKLQIGSEHMIIAEAHHGEKVNNCKGISIYLLPPLNEVSPFYAELAYAQEHRWLTLLSAYHAA